MDPMNPRYGRTLTGAWIETVTYSVRASMRDSSHPHECVDCNAGTLLYVAYLQFVMDRKEEKE